MSSLPSLPLYLGNDHDIRRIGLKVQRTGELLTGVTVRGFIAADPGDMVAMDPTLEIATLTELDDGDFVGTVQGYDLTTLLLAGWEAAKAAGTKYKVYERVVVEDQDYGDVVELIVERDRPPTVRR
jgi:hypothetical protein